MADSNAYVHAQSLQSCPARCDLMNCSLPGPSVHGLLQARILEWVAMPSSRDSSWPRYWNCVSCIFCIAGGFFYHWATWEAPFYLGIFIYTCPFPKSSQDFLLLIFPATAHILPPQSYTSCICVACLLPEESKFHSNIYLSILNHQTPRT